MSQRKALAKRMATYCIAEPEPLNGWCLIYWPYSKPEDADARASQGFTMFYHRKPRPYIEELRAKQRLRGLSKAFEILLSIKMVK